MWGCDFWRYCRDLVFAKQTRREQSAAAYAHWARHELIKAFTLWREETREAIVTRTVSIGAVKRYTPAGVRDAVGIINDRVCHSQVAAMYCGYVGIATSHMS